MSNQTYRMMTVYQRVDQSIREEMRSRVPGALRLLRLRKIKLILQERLRAAMKVASAA